MRRLLPHLLLMLALVFQGAIAFGAVAMADAAPMEHCAGHTSPDASCACCPDGAMGSVGCATQCANLQQAPALLPLIASHPSSSPAIAFVPRLISNPAYAPLIPPPIA